MLNSIRIFPLLLLMIGTLGLTSAAAWASDLSEAQIEVQVQELLLDRHPKENPAEWLSLGSQAPRVLMRLYEKENTSFRRMRLIQGLGFFKDDSEAVEFIKSQAEKTSDDVIRNQVIRVIGAHQGEKEEEFLSRFLSHENPQTRLSAARSLKNFNTAKSKNRYQNYLEEEKAPWVKRELKGEKTSAPVSRVQVSTAVEAPVPVSFYGNWAGHWVALKSQSAVTSAQAVISAGPEVKIEKRDSAGKSTTLWQLARLKGSSSRWVGTALQPGTTTETPAEGRWVNESGEPLLEIRFPQLGSWLLLKRDSKK